MTELKKGRTQLAFEDWWDRQLPEDRDNLSPRAIAMLAFFDGVIWGLKDAQNAINEGDTPWFLKRQAD